VTELSYLQAVVIGALQGVTELFPISSLGHSVLVPALIGGSWKHLVTESSTGSSEQSPYLAFVVALHVATAIALLVFYRRDWVRIIGGFLHTLRTRRVETSAERLAWLIVVATIPVGITGLALEHTFRTLFAKPLFAAVFLTINGLILLAGERLRRNAEHRQGADNGRPSAHPEPDGASGAYPDSRTTTGTGSQPRGLVLAEDRRLDTLAYREAAVIGLFQTLALLAGISRSGVTMVAGLLRGLDHEDAAKFSFLLATPVILAAGVLKLPTLAGPAGAHIHGQVLAGAAAAGVAAYLSVRFLTRYFTTRTLTPFAIYCLVAGVACIIRFA
jgi:undecaprenyl-diphosphatase